jgi:hypothetical protein
MCNYPLGPNQYDAFTETLLSQSQHGDDRRTRHFWQGRMRRTQNCGHGSLSIRHQLDRRECSFGVTEVHFDAPNLSLGHYFRTLPGAK